MTTRTLSLAYSPCPNDTYIFAALTNGLLPNAPPVRAVLEDVDRLNDAALEGRYELTKASYGAIPFLMDRYRILRSGGALGRGCGPLLVARPGVGDTLADFKEKIVAIPGERTTAFMLLRLALGVTPPSIPMRFDTIVDAVAAGAADAGLIIHESRFTYERAGLVRIADLGDWWESTSGMPVPLGAILARNDLDDALARRANDAITQSLRFARENESRVYEYVRRHASEMDDTVMRKHVELYVNAFSDDVGDDGIAAAGELFGRAYAAGIIPDHKEPNFV